MGLGNTNRAGRKYTGSENPTSTNYSREYDSLVRGSGEDIQEGLRGNFLGILYSDGIWFRPEVPSTDRQKKEFMKRYKKIASKHGKGEIEGLYEYVSREGLDEKDRDLEDGHLKVGLEGGISELKPKSLDDIILENDNE